MDPGGVCRLPKISKRVCAFIWIFVGGCKWENVENHWPRSIILNLDPCLVASCATCLANTDLFGWMLPREDGHECLYLFPVGAIRWLLFQIYLFGESVEVGQKNMLWMFQNVVITQDGPQLQAHCKILAHWKNLFRLKHGGWLWVHCPLGHRLRWCLR